MRKSPFFFFTLGSLSIEDRHSNKFRLATLHVYHALLNNVKLPWKTYQYLVAYRPIDFTNLNTWGGEMEGGGLIWSKGKYEFDENGWNNLMQIRMNVLYKYQQKWTVM